MPKMDVKSKQKLKTRRTRKNLDDLRRRSRTDVKINVTPTSNNTPKFKSIPKYNNELTCKRLTLTLFKKTIRSKTVTRVPLSRIESTDNIIKPCSGKAMTNILRNCSHKFYNPFDGINKSSTCENNNKVALGSPKLEELCKKNASGIIVSESEGSDSVNSCSPSHCGLVVLDHSTSKKVSNYMHEYLGKSSPCSNSETESGHCSYEKFMNDLPAYLKEHFPALTSSFVNKNITFLKQSYLEYGNQEKENNTLNCSETTVNIPTNHRELIIHNPVDYIQTSLSWEQSVQKKQSILLPNSSNPSVSDFGASNSDKFDIYNSPQYRYFPHKLNQ